MNVIDSMERARRALARLPASSPPSRELVADVAAAIRDAQRAAYQAAALIPASRVHSDRGLPESQIRRDEDEAVAAAIRDLAAQVT